jgi:ADP-ribose pyrophosphatase YjhB (NUDIX family)
MEHLSKNEYYMDDNEMTKIIRGERVGKLGKIRLGCSAVLMSKDQDQVLLTRRTDNGLWCLPGGMIDPGETVAEGCAREVAEETGLSVVIKRLTGIYSDPDQLVIYPDKNQVQIISINFEVELVSGKLRLSNETTDIQLFPISEAIKMDLFHSHSLRIRDAIALQEAAFIR